MKVLWDDSASYGLVVEPADRAAATFVALDALKAAGSLGELERQDLPPWAARVVESVREDVDDDPDLDSSWDWESMSEVVVDVVPLPWDVRSVAEWLDLDVLRAHADVGGAGLGGQVDGYRVRDRDAFLTALRELGHEPVRDPDLVERYHRAL